MTLFFINRYMYLVALHLKGTIDSQMGHSREYVFKNMPCGEAYSEDRNSNALF